MSPHIAVDAMSGDVGLQSTVPAAIAALSCLPDLSITLVGDPTQISACLKENKQYDTSRLHIMPASEIVEMDELPSQALRRKKDSSMRVMVNALSEKKVDACVSAGNTGALMAISRFVLKTIPGIDRPAIIYPLPAVCKKTHNRKKVYMLDLGANVECSSKQLFQFAVMGSLLASAVEFNLPKPKVCLLNIGEEEIKGLGAIKDAQKQLLACPKVNYQGYIEANRLFTGHADVVVCDGFVGNVALKTVEGMAKLTSGFIRSSIQKSWLTRFLALFALPALLRVKQDLDLRQYNGASLLGLNGIVIKSHGAAKADAFQSAIEVAYHEVKHNVLEKLRHEVPLALKSTR